MVELDPRSAMDLDVTLKNLPLTEVALITAIEWISLTVIDDSISFSETIEAIRKILDE